MKGYIVSIAVASIISAVATMIAPEKWTKYVSIVTGLVITLCIGRPILNIMHADVLGGLDFKTEISRGYSDEEYRKEVIAELENRIAEDVKTRLKTEFRAECDVEVLMSVNENMEITGIEKFSIYGGDIDSVAIGRLREIYDVKEVKHDRHKKNT